MISHVNPNIRRQMVTARRMAMTAGLPEAVQEINRARSACRTPLELIAVGLLECEIYADDLQPREALSLFERHVDPPLSALDPSEAAVIADNKTQLLTNLFEGVGDFYHLVDARRILGVEIRDHASILEARADAAAGKHFNALPAYWQQLRSSYELMHWRARGLAEQDFSEECIQLGWFAEAAYHAMLCGNKKAAERVAEVLLVSRSPEQVGAAVKKMLGAATLREHALQTVRVIANCADAIPDESIKAVTSLLSRHASFEPTGWHDSGLLETTWDAIAAIAHRMDAAAVEALIDTGLKHPVLRNGGPLREHVIDALNALTAQASNEDLSKIADVALGLVTDWRSDMDYTESMDLVCHVADRGGDHIKARIKSALFPPGVEIRDTVMMRVGPFLGWQPRKPESFTNGALQTAEAVRKQVQRLAPDEEPAKIGGYGIFNSTGPAGRIVVHVQGALHMVEALAAHRALIDKAALSSLIGAMLDMIAEPENLVSNRAALAATLREFLDRFPTELEQRAVEVLEPLASGKITEPSQFQSHTEASNPLNPFKFGGGNPVDLRGAALMFLCNLDRRRPNVCPALHDHILLGAMTSAEAEVRRYALFAAADGGNLTSMEWAAIALAGADPDPSVARLALQAMIESEGVKNLEPITWQIVVRAIESAAHSSHGGYRAAAAEMLKALPEPPAGLKPRLEMAKQTLLNDALFSVRRHLK
jgi:hypothetical protein